ncbi:MAG TPA: hypothetical protein VIY08_09900 [Candidatus Nitrosocosmicus sp.]
MNWSTYNQSLVKRGEILLGFDIINNWNTELKEMNQGKIGEPFHYPNTFLLLLGYAKAYSQFELYVTPTGKLPTFMVSTTELDLLITETVFEPVLATYTSLLFELYATPNGPTPTFMVSTTESAQDLLSKSKKVQNNTSNIIGNRYNEILLSFVKTTPNKIVYK